MAIHHERAPVFGLVGPNDEIAFGRFPKGFRAFYTELLGGGNGDQALNDLNSDGAERSPGIEYRLRTAEGAFRDRIRLVLAKLSTGKGKQEQIEAQLTGLLDRPWGEAVGVTAGRAKVKRVIASGMEAPFNRVRDRSLSPARRGDC